MYGYVALLGPCSTTLSDFNRWCLFILGIDASDLPMAHEGNSVPKTSPSELTALGRSLPSLDHPTKFNDHSSSSIVSVS
jgi:hypothetical protein